MFTTQHKQSRHGSTKVPSTMGRATSILASAALLVLSLTPGSSAFQAASRSRRISTAFYVEQSSQTHHQRTRPARPDSATRLKYRDSLDEEGSSSTTAFQPKGWWNKIRTPYASIDPAAQEADSRQAVVDDYLEFLDRRYNRLHAEDDHNNSERRRPEQIKFSAWKWLTQGSDDDDEDGSSTQGQKQEPSTLPEGRQADQENALYVLGVAGLASQKLLQKHQLSVPEQPPALKQAEALTVETTTTQPEASPTVAASKLAYLLRRVSLQRKMLLRYQTQKMQALAKLGIKTVKAGPGKAVRKMLQLGGGGRNVAVTVTLVSAMLFFVIGPLTKAIVSEGAQHA